MEEYKVPLRDLSGSIVEYAFVSKEDYDRVMTRKWCKQVVPHSKSGLCYAISNKSGDTIRMHQFVMAPEGITHNKRSNKYVVDICYNKIRYRSKVYEKLDDAIKDLENYKRGLELAKQIEEKMHLEKEITRNKDGLAVVYATSGDEQIEVIVDDDLWHTLSKMKWSVPDTGYATTHLNDKMVTMHSYVFKEIFKKELKDGQIIDHINNNKLDNRSSNLRANSRGGNSHNKKKKAGSASTYLGVYKNGVNWCGKIGHQGTTYNLGTYKTELEAALAYNKNCITFSDEKLISTL